MENYSEYGMIPKELLAEIGKKKGLTNKEHIEKDYFQDILLYNIFKKTNVFIFKGGTALYKIYRLPRFSEDLDFSLNEGKEKKEVEDIIKGIVNTSGFTIKSIKKVRDSLLIKIACRGILTMYNTVRIDVNLKNKILGGFDVKNYVPEYIDINPFTLRMLTLEEIIAEKIHALLVRQKARDLFDIFFLLRMVKVDEELIKSKLKIFNVEYSNEKLKERVKNLSKIWEKELRPFVLEELPTFEIVEEFVLSKLP